MLSEQLLELKEFLDKHIHLFDATHQDPGYEIKIHVGIIENDTSPVYISVVMIQV